MDIKARPRVPNDESAHLAQNGVYTLSSFPQLTIQLSDQLQPTPYLENTQIWLHHAFTEAAEFVMGFGFILESLTINTPRY